jgi:hypothetical protein
MNGMIAFLNCTETSIQKVHRRQIATYLLEYNILLNHLPLVLQLNSSHPDIDKDIVASLHAIQQIVEKHVRIDKEIEECRGQCNISN